MINKDKKCDIDYILCRDQRVLEIGDNILFNNVRSVVYKITKIPCSVSISNSTEYYDIYEIYCYSETGLQVLKFTDINPNYIYFDENDIKDCSNFNDITIFHYSNRNIFQLENKLKKVQKEVREYIIEMYTNIVIAVLENEFYVGDSNSLISNILNRKNLELVDDKVIVDTIMTIVLDEYSVMKNAKKILNLENDYMDSGDFYRDILMVIKSSLWEGKYNFFINQKDEDATLNNFYDILLKAKNYFIESQEIYNKIQVK